MSPQKAASFLRVSAAVTLLFVPIWGAISYEPVSALGEGFMDLLDWPLDGGHANSGRDVRWLGAVGAGLLAGFGILMLTVVAPQIAKGDASARRGALFALGGWYLIDSIGSVASGVPSNAFFNTGFLVLLGAPLILMKADRR